MTISYNYIDIKQNSLMDSNATLVFYPTLVITFSILREIYVEL